MNPYLLYKDKDFDLEVELPGNAQVLCDDLELKMLFDAMSDEDELWFKVAKRLMLTSVDNDKTTILYRQEILKDCMANPKSIRELYDLSLAAIEQKKASWSIFSSDHPTSVLSTSVHLLEIFNEYLLRLRSILRTQAGNFKSEGFQQFIRRTEDELNDLYFEHVQENLSRLSLSDGVLMRAQLGEANKGIGYGLEKYTAKKRNWWQRIFPPKIKNYHFKINPRDVSGIRVLSEIKDKAVNQFADAIAKSSDHILRFFELLQQELAFYLGCLNLYNRLNEFREPTCFPQISLKENFDYETKNLYDPGLALSMAKKVEGNSFFAGSFKLALITGTNRGGKTTFLRSIGLAQVMMQSGMFVTATKYNAGLNPQIFTHFKKEEDSTIKSGKFDEELSRMNDIVGNLRPQSMLLFNESFASTNEREGSEVALQITRALTEKGIKIFFVTHLYDFAMKLYKEREPGVLFLRAERSEDGSRNYKLKEAEPLPTSYGADLYKKIFEEDS